MKTIPPIQPEIFILVQYVLETKDRLLVYFLLHPLVFYTSQSNSNLLSQLRYEAYVP